LRRACLMSELAETKTRDIYAWCRLKTLKRRQGTLA